MGAERTLRTKATILAAAVLAQGEPCFRGGSHNPQEYSWTLNYNRTIRPFDGVRRFDEYWRVREGVLEPERTQADKRPFSKHPIALGPVLAPEPVEAATPVSATESPESFAVTCTLHPGIAKVTTERYNRGAYNDAVRSAFQAVEHRVQTLLGIHEVGERLMGIALGKPPKITVTRSTGGSLESEQNGMHFLLKGAMGALRNPRSHGSDEKDDGDEADEMLAFAGFLMRRLEKRAAATSGP